MPKDGWMQRAACRGLDVELFYSPDVETAREAVRVCRACPVRRECLETAILSEEQFGVWGGTLERPRRRLLRGTASAA